MSSKTETYTYDPKGMMKTKKDRNQVTTTYTYDVHQRLVSEDVGGEVQTYTYDKVGNQLTQTDSTGTTTRKYDEAGRVIEKTVPNFGKSYYTYDITLALTLGNYAEETKDPAGTITRKVYDKAGRLTSVIANGATSTYTYQANGNRKDITYPNGEKEVYAYDKNNQVKQLDNKKADGSLLQSYSYTYDKAGNQLTKTENKGTTTYVYDNLSRLKSVTEPTGRKTAYTYDKGGNRKTEGVTYGSVTVLTTYTYNTQNRLVQTDTIQARESQKTAYLYDNNGNMTSKVKTTNTQKLATGASLPSFELIIKGQAPDKDLAFYTYNKRNQMIKVVEGTTTSAYKYNADGYRTEKTVGNTSTRYLYEGDKVVAEADGTNQIKARNIYGTNLLSRQVDNELLFYMYNAHGDVTALINATGAVVATYDYDAFGTITEKTGTVNNSITYAGYQYDAESDMYYLNARYYDSKIARFMTEDTYRGQANDPLSLNLYSYVSNNPVRYYDPTGHWQQGDEKLSADKQAQLIAITNAYYSASTSKAKDDLHKKAEAIRKASTKVETTSIGTQMGQQIKSVVDDVLGNTKKYINEKDWKKVLSTVGITYKAEESKYSYDKYIDTRKATNIITTFGKSGAISVMLDYESGKKSAVTSIKTDINQGNHYTNVNHNYPGETNTNGVDIYKILTGPPSEEKSLI